MKQLRPFNFLKRVLLSINETYIEHGIRVAYVAYEILRFRGVKDRCEIKKIVDACIFHDIGAFKTEFSDLTSFEISNTLNHSVYGFLFLKYLTTFKDSAEAILFHHNPYSNRNICPESIQKDALLINLCDRVDVSQLNFCNTQAIGEIKKLAGFTFDPQDVADFVEANKKFRILENLCNGKAETTIERFLNSFPTSESELIDYLKMATFSIDFKSEQTVGHSIHTAFVSQYLAKLNNMSDKACQDVFVAALVHDIGKLRTPSHILESTEKLSPLEMDTMRLHVAETEKILNNMLSKKVVKIACRHHERLDGSGYPLGLVAKQLTLSDKIVASADMFAALVAKRSYKKAMDKTQVIDLLKNEIQCKRLDKLVTDQITSNYDNIMAELSSQIGQLLNSYNNLNAEYAVLLKTHVNLENPG